MFKSRENIFSLQYILTFSWYILERRCVMNYELYQKKYQYERLINVLQNNYNNLNDVYYSLISCRKIIKESIEIDGVYYNKKTLDNMIKKIEV